MESDSIKYEQLKRDYFEAITRLEKSKSYNYDYGRQMISMGNELNALRGTIHRINNIINTYPNDQIVEEIQKALKELKDGSNN